MFERQLIVRGFSCWHLLKWCRQGVLKGVKWRTLCDCEAAMTKSSKMLVWHYCSQVPQQVARQQRRCLMSRLKCLAAA